MSDTADERNPASPYIQMYYTTRIPMLLVYKVYRRSYRLVCLTVCQVVAGMVPARSTFVLAENLFPIFPGPSSLGA